MVIVTAPGDELIFGLVTHAEPERQSSQANIVGTAEYMAPEQAAAGEVGPAAAWYSVGVMLYEALTGQLPHVGKTALDILMKKQRQTPPPPRQWNPGVPEDPDELCVELLRLAPEERPQSNAMLRRLVAARAS